MRLRLIAAAIASLCLTSCEHAPTTVDAAEPSREQAAKALIERVNREAYARNRESNAAQWTAATYINADTQILAAKASERDLAYQAEILEQLRALQGVQLPATEARQLDLLIEGRTVLPPGSERERETLTTLAAKLEAHYGSAKACADPAKPESCRDLMQLSDVLARSRDPATLRQAWVDWHNTARAQREDYQRFAELLNRGAQAYGYRDAGELWRAGYDMDAAAFAAETERLWSQVEPLYGALHCYVRNRLHARYGNEVPATGPIPGHVLGNMWQQDWSNVYPLVEPYPGAATANVTQALETDAWSAERMTRQAESFYTSLGMPALPAQFWERSMLVKPRDREVQCHASAWDIDMRGDVRIKMCIVPDEENLKTIYHELGHVYYYLAYHAQPPIFQTGAHDGFHEAIGDTVVLSLTPAYLKSIGLTDKDTASKEAAINQQMKMALEKIAFLPFGKLIDQWRWGVFDGSITPEYYNAAWWDLKRRYQGVMPPVARTEADFDPAAKYHVPANTPYTRYFLAHILQFQFHQALCKAAGHQGPLHECSIAGNPEAGRRFWAMLAAGASQPWQDTLEQLTGTREMNAEPVLEYFAPLKQWLDERNHGQRCGW